MTLLTGLAAYYPFDENTGTAVFDSTSNHYDGTYQGTLGSQWISGKLGASALSFDGSDNYVSLSSGLSVTSNFSIACWVYASVTGTQAILGSTSSGGLEFRIGQSSGSGVLELLSQSVASIATSSASLPVPGTTWVHVGVTYDSSGNYVFYVNGSPAGSGTNFHSINSATLNVARYGEGAGAEYLHGAIDELGVWSRVLTSTEFSQLYNGGAGLQYPFTIGGTPSDCSFLFQPNALLNHPNTLDTNEPKDNLFAGWGKPSPSQLAFWFQPPFLGPIPKSTQNTNQAFFISPKEPKTPTTPLNLRPAGNLHHIPTIYTAQSFVCNPTIGPPVTVDAFWTQAPDLLNHPHSLDTNQPKDNFFTGWTNNNPTPSSLGFFTQPQHLLRHAPTLDTRQPFVNFPVPTGATPADCSFLFQPSALLTHPQTLDTNQQKDNFFAGWAATTPTQFGFWTQPPNLLRHSPTLDTNQPRLIKQDTATPASLGFWTQAPDLLHHPSTLVPNQQAGFFVAPTGTVPSNATIEHWSFAPIGHFAIGQGTLPAGTPTPTPADCSFLFEASPLLNHPATLDTNQQKDNFFFGWAQNITPTALDYWTQAPDLLRHPVTVDTNQPRVSYQDKATTASLAFWDQAPNLIRHPTTIDTNQSRVSYQDKATPSALGFWTQAPNLLRHANTVDTNQPFSTLLASSHELGDVAWWTQPPDLLRHPNTLDTNQPRLVSQVGATPASLGFWTQAPNLLRHPNTLDTNQSLDDALAGWANVTPGPLGFVAQIPDLLRHPVTLDTNQALDDTFAGWAKPLTPSSLGFFVQPPDLFKHPATLNTQQSFKYLPPPQPPFGWLVQPPNLLRHPVPFILGGEYSFALLPPKITANRIIKVYFFN